jgi:hypothetical protein
MNWTLTTGLAVAITKEKLPANWKAVARPSNWSGNSHPYSFGLGSAI